VLGWVPITGDFLKKGFKPISLDILFTKSLESPLVNGSAKFFTWPHIHNSDNAIYYQLFDIFMSQANMSRFSIINFTIYALE